MATEPNFGAITGNINVIGTYFIANYAQTWISCHAH